MPRTIDDPRLPLIETLETRQLLSAGQLDTTFGDAGQVLTDEGLAYGNNVAVQADGKIVAAATGDDFRDFHLVRYNPDGSLDTTFGNGGIVSSTFAGTHSDFVSAMVVQADGKIVIAGNSSGDDAGATLVVRYNADGTLDTTFGDAGIVRLPGDTYPNDGAIRAMFSPGRALLAAQADGKVLVTQILGDDGSATGADLVVVRLTDTGALDTTFGDGGKATVELGAIDFPQDIALQADGKVVVAVDAHALITSGDSTSWPTLQTHVVRLNADGSLDTSFGTGGVVTENHTLDQITATRVAIGLDGKILLMGQDYNTGGDVQSFLVRLNTDGSRDTAFGAGGKRVLGGNEATYAGLLVQPDGKLVLTGALAGGANGNSGLFSQRLNADGTPDTDYGTGGTTRVPPHETFDFGRAAALQADGSIIVIGFSNKAATPEDPHDGSDITLVRFQGDAGAAGSTHFSLRRGIDQQAEYTGRPAGHHHRSPKRRAMEQAAAAAAAGKRHHRSPKRRAQDEARQAAAAAAAPKATTFNATKKITDDDQSLFA